MNRLLEKINLAGVIALAGLCVFQWRVNRDVNTEVIRLQKAQQEQSAKIAEQEKTIGGQTADLETFRTHLTTAKSGEKELRGKLAESERANSQLGVEADQLKNSLTNWVAAVNERDKQLQLATEQLKGVVEARDEAIEKYNALAKTHNQLVAEVNRTRTNAAASK